MHACMYVSKEINNWGSRNRKHCQAAAKLAACAHSLSGRNLACDSGPVVYTYRLNFIWIDVLWPMTFWGKKTTEMSQFWPNFHILGALVHIPFTDPGKIQQETVDRWSTLTHQISFESVCCITFQGQKPQFWANFDIWGSCAQPRLPTRDKFGMLQQTHGLRSHVKFHLDQFILLPSGSRKPQILPFFDFGIKQTDRQTN